MKKVSAIITDLDGCLWTETLAEKQNLNLNNEYFSFLKDLHNKGVQLFVISKNDPIDVIEAFLKLGIDSKIFTEVIVNWEPKYLNIEKLLHQTNIRPETVIFIDDNIFELSEVNIRLPEIKCINYTNWKSELNNEYFNSLHLQSESEREERINRYRTSIHSSKLKETIREDRAFLKLLKRKIAIGEISSPTEIERFARLLALTHRINFNPEKFKDSDEAMKKLNEKINTNNYVLFGVSIWENDLSLGLSGGFVVKLLEETAYVEDATFSCGIIGRDFEQKAILELISTLKNVGIKEIVFYIRLTSTNLRVNEILNELEFRKSKVSKDKSIFKLDIVNYKPIKNYDWIKVIDNPIFFEHFGVPVIIDFFDNQVIPLIKPNYYIINLGSARGEVIGHLQQERKRVFNRIVEKYNATFIKIDLEEIPQEHNIIGNAENLTEIVNDETCDLVMAIELLEHTQHFWKVIDEMIRICKVNGYLFITVPTCNYPKHEYPIDLWRIGPSTLLSFFPEDKFEVIKFLKEGDLENPRRLLLLVRKKMQFKTEHEFPFNGKTDWKTGITFFK